MSINPVDVSMVDVSSASASASANPGSGSSSSSGSGLVSDSTGHNDGQQHGNQESEPHPSGRRKSTLILTDDIDFDRMHIDDNREASADASSSEQMNPEVEANQSQTNQQGGHTDQIKETPGPNVTIPVDIKWVQGGEKVYVTGSFTGWRKMIGLVKQPDGNFLITLGLPVGTHRFRFVIDNELRFSDFLPTATDQMGNFVNYIEVTPDHIYSHLADQENQQAEPEHAQTRAESQSVSRKSSISRTTTRSDSMWGLTNDDDDMGNGYSRYHDEENSDATSQFNNIPQYINDIPPIFTDPKVMEQYYVAIDKQSKVQSGQQQAWLHPPQIPPHLEHVILNSFSAEDNNSGALPIPNHVVLNHLATTSIKHNTLAVASIVRYKRKYLTQVLYAPLQQ